MTRVTNSGQLEWIFEATVEELENELETLRKKHDTKIIMSNLLAEQKDFVTSLDFLNDASDILSMMRKISNELISRTWDGDL